jgi:hypothetical protein
MSMKCKNVNMTTPLWRPDRPYNDLQPLPPEAELEIRAVLEERSAGREKLFLHPKLLQLLSSEDNEVVPYS